MSPTIDALKNEIASATTLLRQPCAESDATLRQLLADRFWAEKQQAAILDWLPRIEQKLEQIIADHAAALREKDARIAELESAFAAIQSAPSPAVIDAHPLDEITGHKRKRETG